MCARQITTSFPRVGLRDLQTPRYLVNAAFSLLETA